VKKTIGENLLARYCLTLLITAGLVSPSSSWLQLNCHDLIDICFFPWLYGPWRTLAASHIGGFLSYLDIW
jgi:hypothetical protein